MQKPRSADQVENKMTKVGVFELLQGGKKAKRKAHNNAGIPRRQQKFSIPQGRQIIAQCG